MGTGNAMVEVARRIGPELITVCLEFGERVHRGLWRPAAVKSLPMRASW
jgi:hypothetical protein